jgi:hypothetical protein
LAIPQGATFVFGSWVCIANGSGDFDSHLANPIEPEVILSESCITIPDLTKKIELKLDDKLSSNRTQIDFNPSPTRVETLLTRPIFGLSNASSAYQRMIKSIYSSNEASLD